MSDRKPRIVERVLVAINAPLRSDDLLVAAVEFASSFGTPLTALFVEDVNLVKLSELPFAKELDGSSGVLRPLDPQSVGHALETEARKLQQRLLEESKKRRISVSMQVVRGHYARTAVQMARSRDVVFVEDVVRRSFGTASKEVHRPPQDKPRIWHKPVWVYYDASKRTRRALVLASNLGRTYDLDVVILAADAAGEEDIAKQIKKIAGDRRQRCRVLRLSDEKTVTAAVQKRGCAVLILPREEKHTLGPEFIESVAHCPRILV